MSCRVFGGILCEDGDRLLISGLHRNSASTGLTSELQVTTLPRFACPARRRRGGSLVGLFSEDMPMGRYTGPKARINRRLGFDVFESAGAQRASERKAYPPGMAQRRRKQTVYGLALTEKQKIRFYYGLREKHLRSYFDKARSMKGNTGEQLLILCERRLDNMVRRAGFCKTRPQARQGVAHGHFQVNGRTVTCPSYQVRQGDVVTVRNRPNLQKLYKDRIGETMGGADWINADLEGLTATVTSLPSYQDVMLPVDVGSVVAFLSR